jgi:hypothetical protein
MQRGLLKWSDTQVSVIATVGVLRSALVLLSLLSTTPAQTIIGAEPNGTGHPYVGAIYSRLCLRNPYRAGKTCSSGVSGLVPRQTSLAPWSVNN